MKLLFLSFLWFFIQNINCQPSIIFEHNFLLNSQNWIIVGNKHNSPVLHQPYSLIDNYNVMSNYITAKDDLINVDYKHKNDKNLWFFKSPPIKLIIQKNRKPFLLTFTMTSFIGDFNKLNHCSAFIKIYSKGVTFFYPPTNNYDGNMVSFNIPLINKLWHTEDGKQAQIDTIFDEKFEIEIFGDWTTGVEVIGLDNVRII